MPKSTDKSQKSAGKPSGGKGEQSMLKEVLSWVEVIVIAVALAFFIDNVIIIKVRVLHTGRAVRSGEILSFSAIRSMTHSGKTRTISSESSDFPARRLRSRKEPFTSTGKSWRNPTSTVPGLSRTMALRSRFRKENI